MTAGTPARRGIVCGRLAASRSFIKGIHLYAYPAGAYFCMRKSRQNALGAVPQDPLTLKLRLDTNWTFQQILKSRSVRRRRYALKVPAAHFYVEIVDRVPLLRCGGGGKLGSPLPCFASFCRSKRKDSAASGAYYAFAKGSATPISDYKLAENIFFLLLITEK